MKKFKKPLLINVPEDDHHESKSPSRIGAKQNKQKSLLLFNEHTIASSVNNEDEFLEQEDKHMPECEQFIDYQAREKYQKNPSPTNKQANEVNNNNLKRNKKFNIIEFEQFMVQGDKNKQNQLVDPKQKRLLHNYHRKMFSIEIPEEQHHQRQELKGHHQYHEKQISAKFQFDLKGGNEPLSTKNKQMKQHAGMKQPPAPSNKSSQGKSLPRKFVFPTNDQKQAVVYNNESNNFCTNTNLTQSQNASNNNNKKQNLRQTFTTDVRSISQQDHQSIINELQIEFKQKIEQMSKSFEKERQQFYKQKSRLEKDLMIKDGQIEMLQRLITNRYSPSNSTIGQTNNHHHQSAINNNYGDKSNDINKKQLTSQSITIQKSKTFYVSDEKITAMETLLLQKDLQINSLLEKINNLNQIIEQKNTELEDVKIGLLKSQKLNESLRNEVFIHQKKDESQKITKQFYKVKQTLIQVQKSTKTPKAAYSKPKWHEDSSLEIEKQRQKQKGDYPFRGIDDLHKRLESLKMNRIELQTRSRIKSQINYPQTSKNKVKGTFDFKGKFYDRERDYNIRGAPY